METEIPSFNHSRSTQSESDKNNNDIGSKIEQQDLPPTIEEELRLPVRNLTIIMQRVLPLHAQISDDAKNSIQMCVSEFMNIIMSEARERCKVENRNIVTADDLIWAMNKLGFEDYAGILATFLKNYRDHEVMFNKNGSSASASSSGGNGQG